MRIKSKIKDAYLERWQTPVTDLKDLRFETMLTAVDVHFLFSDSRERERKKTIYVMSAWRLWPCRVIEEKFARLTIGKYVMSAQQDKKKDDEQNSWKLWGTTFLDEIIGEGKPAISHYGTTPDRDIIEYLVKTSSKWIGVVSWRAPEWEIFRDTTVTSVVRHYLKGI